MIECKEDVVVWFRQLESYKRIDAMCTLLTSCLSFELRFLGTYLEDLASRDYEGLRSIELRVSNAPELVQNLATCQQAVPTDQRVRRMMAMYLALIRNVNRKCCNELYKTLELWGRRECMDKYVAHEDEQLFVQELLLIYIMAKNHPVLAFEQRLKCAEIFQILYEQMVIGGTEAPHGSSQQQQQHQQPGGNECPSGSSSNSPSPTMPDYVQAQLHLQQKQQSQAQAAAAPPLNYSQQQQQLHGHSQQQIHAQHHQQAHPHHHQQQQQQHQAVSHLYGGGGGGQQHPQLIQTASGGQYQVQQAPSAGQPQHIQVHPGHQLMATYPQLIQTSDGLSQVQQQQQQQQSQQAMGISMDQFQTVAAMPQYLESPFMTAAGTTVSAAGGQLQPQSIPVQWPTAYRHAAPTIDTSIPPPQIPILPQSSTSSSSSLIISQSSSPTQSRTTSPVRVVVNTGGGGGGGSGSVTVTGSSGRTAGGGGGAGGQQQITTKRASRRPSADQTPPQADMMTNKTYEENPDILRNGYARQPGGRSGGSSGRLEKTYSIQHHHHQQQQQQQQYQAAAHHNFHMHPQYTFMNHQQLAAVAAAAHHQQQLIPTGMATGLPHGIDYVTYSSKAGTIPGTISLATGGGLVGGQLATGSDSGSNSNDDCSPSETPTGTIMPGLVQTSALQSRLLNPQLMAGSGKGGGGSSGSGGGVIYVNSSNVSPSGGGQNNSNSSSLGNNNNNNSSNELSAGPPMSSSPSPVSVVAVNPYVKTSAGVFARYGTAAGVTAANQSQLAMTVHGEILNQDIVGGGGDPTQPVYAYNTNHFVTHHHPAVTQQQHLHQQQQHHNTHMLRTTGAPSGIQVQMQVNSPPPQQQQPPPQSHIPPGMSMLGGQGTTAPLLNYSAVPVTSPTTTIGQQIVGGGVGLGMTVGQQIIGGGAISQPISGGYVVSPKSCFNCGSQAHSGLECRETSMEDAIHHSNYKLDYKIIQAAGGEELAEEMQGGGGSVMVGSVEGDRHRRRRRGENDAAAEEEDEEQDFVAAREVDEDEVVEVLDDEDDDVQIIEDDEIVEHLHNERETGGGGVGGAELTHRFNSLALQQTQAATTSSSGGGGDNEMYRTQHQGAGGGSVRGGGEGKERGKF